MFGSLPPALPPIKFSLWFVFITVKNKIVDNFSLECIRWPGSYMLHFVQKNAVQFCLLSGICLRQDFTSRVQVDGVDLIEAAVDASCLEEEAVIRAGRHGVTPPCLALQHIKPWEEKKKQIINILFHSSSFVFPWSRMCLQFFLQLSLTIIINLQPIMNWCKSFQNSCCPISESILQTSSIHHS